MYSLLLSAQIGYERSNNKRNREEKCRGSMIEMCCDKTIIFLINFLVTAFENETFHMKRALADRKFPQ